MTSIFAFFITCLTSLAAFAASEGPMTYSVLTGTCGTPEQEWQRNFATVLASDQRLTVIAGSALLSDEQLAKSCFQLEGSDNRKTPLKLLVRDGRMGLAVFEPLSPVDLQKFPSDKYMNKNYGDGNDDLYFGGSLLRLLTYKSERHFFANGLELMEVVYESALHASEPFTAGGPIGTGRGVRGLFSDQTLLLLPGKAAQPLRAWDLRLLKPGATLYRLVFPAKMIGEWLQQVSSPAWTPELTPMSELRGTATYNKMLWNVRGQLIREVCDGVGSDDGSTDAPIGGIKNHMVLPWDLKLKSAEIDRALQENDVEKMRTLHLSKKNPLFYEQFGEQSVKLKTELSHGGAGGSDGAGVGGLMDLLSHCRLAIVQNDSVRPLLLAYRRTEKGNLQARSLLNVHDLMNIQDEKQWKFLMDDDDLANEARGSVLADLREKAYRARLGILAVYATRTGNPLVLREAYLLANLMKSKDWKETKPEDVDRLLMIIDQQLPIDLAETGPRDNPARSEFAAKRALMIQTLQDLKGARARCP